MECDENVCKICHITLSSNFQRQVTSFNLKVRQVEGGWNATENSYNHFQNKADRVQYIYDNSVDVGLMLPYRFNFTDFKGTTERSDEGKVYIEREREN